MATASITYQKPGTEPPIYVAGTFSDPPWEAHEMGYTTSDDGEHTFTKQIVAEPGRKIQYKFRVGEGDWWVLHEGMPTVTDHSGNTNHEMEVPHPDGLPADGQAMEKNKQDEPISPKTMDRGKPSQPSVDKVPEGLAKHILASHSGASTPNYAGVAAEVADSAAILNKEKPETPVPDDLAGKIGYRRLTSTPIGEVASTAAEVADTARDLDNAELKKLKPEFNILLDDDPSYALTGSSHDFHDNENESSSAQPPLFAHEAVGMFDDVSYGDDVVEDFRRGSRAFEGEDIDQDNIDVNDPTLERFPSNREAIIDTVRKLETGLDEDQASFEGVPLSPVISMSRRGTEDNIGDFVLSPVPISPVMPRSARRLEVTRSPRGSIASAHSSTASLQAIDETEEPDQEEESKVPHVIRLSTPRGRSPLRNSFKFPRSDEDEGVVMKNTRSSDAPKGENGKLLSAENPGSSSRDSSRDSPESSEHKNGNLPEEADGGSKKPTAQMSRPSTSRQAQNSPRIVIEAPVSADGADGGASTTGTDRGTNGSTTRLRKTGDWQAEQATTRGSVPAAAIPPERKGRWFKAFFRLLFVDWIGGFISRLCGGRRKT
ncbi:hypothetical protein B0T14DRAFT_494978 [Immersiella caudata]|uniref:AMP-activated protein kinase glycogen-binding domain-containing protein n=1 Tax=Immersiella caudata TaxID=314043 RepID=A0AA40C3B4_9PEZI|nr:hypothetical protein B0T14DRAFT_494978 [Immersiella caudata]